MKKTLLLLLIASTLFSCKKKIDFGPNEGIDYRDFNNNPGPGDASDWTSDGTWNKQEKKLFDDLGINLNSTAQGGIREIFFYPNPIETQGNFGYAKTGTSSLTAKYVVVDRKYQVLQSGTLPSIVTGRNNIMLDFSGSKFESGEIYRMYYVFYQGSTLYYKGHGDIKMAD